MNLSPNINNITQVRLVKENYNKLYEHQLCYTNVVVDKSNYLKYIDDLQLILKYINIQLDWPDCPTFSQLEKRFKAGSKTMLFYYNNECIGWAWWNDNITFNWIDINQTLPSNIVYAGGVYVVNTKIKKRPDDAGRYNYNVWFEYLMNLNYTVYGYIDNWNHVAFKINYRNGMKNFIFLKPTT